MEYSYENDIIAYNFEPEYSEIELAEIERNLKSQDGEQAQQPTSIGDFCTCQNCIVMPSPHENVCCNESDLTVGNLDECSCITDLPVLQTVVLNTTVLEVSYIQLMAFKRSRGRAPDQLNNTQYRLCAYRQFVGLMMKGERLGKGNRVVIPACVVSMIRKAFPSPTYCGFMTSISSLHELFQ